MKSDGTRGFPPFPEPGHEPRPAEARSQKWAEETTPTYLDEGWDVPSQESGSPYDAEMTRTADTLSSASLGGHPLTADLRFGPGVPPPAPPDPTLRWDATPRSPLGPDHPGPDRPTRSPWWWRFKLALLVLVVVAGYLTWRNVLAKPLEIQHASVYGPPKDLGCGETALVMAVVRTNGAEGVIRYRWQRSDGTLSESLRETVPRGRNDVRLETSWSFSGQGRLDAEATLIMLAPAADPVSVSFRYRCSSG
ncbi:hypothetical protein ACIOMM_34875 [Streptomyces sp. NPDC087908]|uniref:hypothetical protein n=1 Tax=Streptomyces sp. NPDC087908 TaxID=3365820 RepID=UPI00380997B8